MIAFSPLIQGKSLPQHSSNLIFFQLFEKIIVFSLINCIFFKSVKLYKMKNNFSHLLTLDYYPEEVAALVAELDLERFVKVTIA